MTFRDCSVRKEQAFFYCVLGSSLPTNHQLSDYFRLTPTKGNIIEQNPKSCNELQNNSHELWQFLLNSRLISAFQTAVLIAAALSVCSPSFAPVESGQSQWTHHRIKTLNIMSNVFSSLSFLSRFAVIARCGHRRSSVHGLCVCLSVGHVRESCDNG